MSSVTPTVTLHANLLTLPSSQIKMGKLTGQYSYKGKAKCNVFSCSGKSMLAKKYLFKG